MSSIDERLVQTALEYLAPRCRYHGHNLDGDGRNLAEYEGACCATGQEPRARREALAALLRITAERKSLQAKP